MYISWLDGEDILLFTGTLVFPPGATLGAIVIPIIDDEVAEPPEFFRVNLSPGEDVTLTTSLATVNINDNDGQYN